MVPSLRAAIQTSGPVFWHDGLTTITTVVSALAINFLFAPGHDLQRCVEVVALCIVAILFLFQASKGHIAPMATSTAVLLSGFFGLGLVSVTTAYSLRHAVYEWSSLLLLLMLVFAIANELMRDGRRLDSLLQWVGIMCGLYSLRLIVMYAAALASGLQVDMYVLIVGFSNPRFLNHTQTALLPLIVLLCVQAPRAGMWRKTWFILASFWWALLFVCEARASILALAAGCIAALVLRRFHARQFLVTMAGTVLAGIVLYALLFIFLPELAGQLPISTPMSVVARTAADPTSARNLLWKLAWELIRAHPWFGVGPQQFAHASASLYTGAHPHNWLLQFAAEWGIPALLCLLGTVFLGVRALVRSGARLAAGDVTQHQILATLQVACAAICCDGLLSGVIVMPQSQLAIALVLGVTYGWVRTQDKTLQPAAPLRSAPLGILCMMVVAAAAGSLIWSVAPDFVAHARDDALTPAELAKNPGAHWPRLWGAGYF